MTHQRHLLSLGFLIFGITSQEIAAQATESQYVQALEYDDAGPVRDASTFNFAQAGRFLPGGQQRAGAVVLQLDQGISQLLYLDPLGIWNSGTRFPLPTAAATDAAILPGAGPDSLDAIAVSTYFGLQIFAANANGDGFDLTHFHSGWYNASRIFAVEAETGLELHGYVPSTNTVRRSRFDLATSSLIQQSSYPGLNGFDGALAANVQAGGGNELVVWSAGGRIEIRSADGALVLQVLRGGAMTAPGTFHLVAVPTTDGDALAWCYKEPDSGITMLDTFSINSGITTYVLPSFTPSDILAADWTGDGQADIVMGGFDSDGVAEVRCFGVVPDSGTLDTAQPVLIDAIDGDYYAGAVDRIMAIDCDRDGDVDLFALGESQTTLQSMFNDRQNWRANLEHTGTPLDANQKLNTDFTINFPGDYSQLLSTHSPSDLRVRLRFWAKGEPSQPWDLDNREERLYSLPAGFPVITTLAGPQTLNFQGVPFWNTNRFQLLAHLALVEVDIHGEVVREFPTSIWSVVPNSTDRANLLIQIDRELTGTSEAPSELDGDDVHTGRPSGNPPGGPPPSSAGG